MGNGKNKIHYCREECVRHRISLYGFDLPDILFHDFKVMQASEYHGKKFSYVSSVSRI